MNAISIGEKPCWLVRRAAITGTKNVVPSLTKWASEVKLSVRRRRLPAPIEGFSSGAEGILDSRLGGFTGPGEMTLTVRAVPRSGREFGSTDRASAIGLLRVREGRARGGCFIAYGALACYGLTLPARHARARGGAGEAQR